MPSNHLILCHPLLLLPSIFPSIRVFYPYVLKVTSALANLHLSLFHSTLDPGRLSPLEYFRGSLPSIAVWFQPTGGRNRRRESGRSASSRLDEWCLSAFLNLSSHRFVSCSVVSDSLRPPARLLCLWHFPGRNTGVGKPFPYSENLPDSGIGPGSPALQADSLPSEPLLQHFAPPELFLGPGSSTFPYWFFWILPKPFKIISLLNFFKLLGLTVPSVSCQHSD